MPQFKTSYNLERHLTTTFSPWVKQKKHSENIVPVFLCGPLLQLSADLWNCFLMCKYWNMPENWLDVNADRGTYDRPLNRTSSRIVRVAAASGLTQDFRIVFPPKVKFKNSTSSVYSGLYGTWILTHVQAKGFTNQHLAM